jgi:hypothetical protein
MKKIIYTIALMTGALLAHSQTPAENMVAAEAKVKCARADLVVAEKELAAAFPPFKKDAQVQIKANDKTISDLRTGFVKPFKSSANDASKVKIDDLEARNVDLRSRLYTNEE